MLLRLKRIIRIASDLNSPIKNRCQANTEWVFRKSAPQKIRVKNLIFSHFFKRLKAQNPSGIFPALKKKNPKNLPQIQCVTHGTSTVAATT
jgi:hypothetical protein